jgi:hypothetical protein
MEKVVANIRNSGGNHFFTEKEKNVSLPRKLLTVVHCMTQIHKSWLIKLMMIAPLVVLVLMNVR